MHFEICQFSSSFSRLWNKARPSQTLLLNIDNIRMHCPQ
ncbi:hypothetical protein [uncultured Gammaproteobacteria bacterium]|nr:hypothetical protein [uncultured Gammaproteobacteria bacterium]